MIGFTTCRSMREAMSRQVEEKAIELIEEVGSQARKALHVINPTMDEDEGFFGADVAVAVGDISLRKFELLKRDVVEFFGHGFVKFIVQALAWGD